MKLWKFTFIFATTITLFSCTKKTDTNLVSDNNNDVVVPIKGQNSTNALAVKKFLFDASQAETAGNADWVIDEDNSNPQRIPTPLQSSVTSTTSSTYWTGALSSWGIALAKLGQSVETLPSTGLITYGVTTNAQDLKNYNVFVVDEPNIRFTTSEKQAILAFVQNGGGLFMIGDHTISDRNNDGWDSPAIWNDLMTSNGVITNPFGFSFELTDITQLSTNVRANSSTNPLINGLSGSVTKLDFHNGATLALQPTVNPTVQGLFWQNGIAQTSTTKVMAAASTYGTGRVYCVTDSSPMDDGSGATGNVLYASWGLSTNTHVAQFMNASLWLAKLQ